MSVTVTLEDKIQCHELRDRGHSVAEFHDPIFVTCADKCMRKMESFVIPLRELLAHKVLFILPKN